MSYHQFIDYDTDSMYGSFEVWEQSPAKAAYAARAIAAGADPESVGPDQSGFYWWPCWPGCVPDGFWTGPFDSVEAAIDNARHD